MNSKLRLGSHYMTIHAFIGKLRSLLFFVDDKKAQDQFIKQRILEIQSSELRVLLADKTLSHIATFLTDMPRQSALPPVLATTPTHRKIVCYNCGVSGHLSRECTKRRSRCSQCNKSGHILRFCRQTLNTSSKNGAVAALLEDQSSHVTSAQFSDQ